MNRQTFELGLTDIEAKRIFRNYVQRWGNVAEGTVNFDDFVAMIGGRRFISSMMVRSEAHAYT